MSKILLAPQLAERLGLSPKSLYSIRARNPERLPPAEKIPGGRRLFWKEEKVERWILEQTTTLK